MKRRQLKPMLLARMLYAGQGGDLGKKPDRPASTKNAGPFHHPLDIDAERLKLERDAADRFAVVHGHDEAGELIRLVRPLCCRFRHSLRDNASRSLNQALPDVDGALPFERFSRCDKLIPEPLSPERRVGFGP